MKKQIIRSLKLLLTLSLLSSLSFAAQKSSTFKPTTFVAKYTSQPILLDGADHESIWKNAPAYPLNRPKDTGKNLTPSLQASVGTRLQESGTVRFLWNEQGLYVRGDFQDSDIAAEGEKDQEHHYTTGDLMEVFLKPAAQTWYWELYATPHKKKTTFFFPGRGRMVLPSCTEYSCELGVDALLNGTLNEWKDRDQGWTSIMSIPVKSITSFGDNFGVRTAWKIMIGRYNYSRYLPQPELSSAPQLSVTNFHLQEEYAILSLEP